jgi:hypothetical protein
MLNYLSLTSTPIPLVPLVLILKLKTLEKEITLYKNNTLLNTPNANILTVRLLNNPTPIVVAVLTIVSASTVSTTVISPTIESASPSSSLLPA